MSRSLLSRPLARRIDRLARRAHAFHRWAHHPVCDRYGGEVVRLGRRTRVCRGCLLALGGGLTGALLGAFLPPAPGPALLAAAAALCAAFPLALPGRPRAAPDDRLGARRALPKLATRLAPALAAGFLAASALAHPGAARLAAAAPAIGAIAWAAARYRRRGPDRSACQGCPSGPAGTACPGFAPLAAREHALQRLAGRWIAAEQAAAGRGPPGVSR